MYSCARVKCFDINPFLVDFEYFSKRMYIFFFFFYKNVFEDLTIYIKFRYRRCRAVIDASSCVQHNRITTTLHVSKPSSFSHYNCFLIAPLIIWTLSKYMRQTDFVTRMCTRNTLRENRKLYRIRLNVNVFFEVVDLCCNGRFPTINVF